MTIRSLSFDLNDADGCVLPLAAALVLVDVAGALASDWISTVEYVCRLFLLLDIWYVFGAFSACESPALLPLLEAERLKIDNMD